MKTRTKLANSTLLIMKRPLFPHFQRRKIPIPCFSGTQINHKALVTKVYHDLNNALFYSPTYLRHFSMRSFISNKASKGMGSVNGCEPGALTHKDLFESYLRNIQHIRMDHRAISMEKAGYQQSRCLSRILNGCSSLLKVKQAVRG